jgi:hypothetical protein
MSKIFLFITLMVTLPTMKKAIQTQNLHSMKLSMYCVWFYPQAWYILCRVIAKLSTTLLQLPATADFRKIYQEDIWCGDMEKILTGIRHQWEHWEAFDQGYFIPKLKAEQQNSAYLGNYGYDQYVFVEPTDDTLKQPLKYE